MNPFQRARSEARIVREKLAPGKASQPIKAAVLLAAVEPVLRLGIEPVAPTYPDLGEGTAVLHREQSFIFISNEVKKWSDEYCGLIAHELGHWRLDVDKAPKKVAKLKTGGDGSAATMQVEAYGARERQELQANVFARELLLPREVAQKLAAEGTGAEKAAETLGIPLEFARQQMLDALLLPPGESNTTTLQPASGTQERAAKATERAANVVAGPGTGKTSTLIHRVKHLVEDKKVDPSQILVLTFTNKAALELTERLRAAGIARAADIWAGTFHAFGLEFMRKFHQHFGLESDFNIADALTSMTALAASLPVLDLRYHLRTEDPYTWLKTVIDGIKRLKEELISPAEYRKRIAKIKPKDEEQQRRREDFALLYVTHEKQLALKKTADFVDLIARPALALLADRVPFTELADKFQHILVDEYQDVSHAMVVLLRELARGGKSIWVVGDLRQAIHHWRGASIKSLLKFNDSFEQHAGKGRIKEYSLDVNHRSCEEVVELFQEVGRNHVLQTKFRLGKMTANKGRCGQKPKVITSADPADELDAVIEGIKALQAANVPFGRQAVLCRDRLDVERAALRFAQSGIPIIHIGELGQRLEVKTLMCLMQLLVERQPRALLGLMHIPELAMPVSDVLLLVEEAPSRMELQRGRWLWEPPEELSKKGRNVTEKLAKLLSGWNHYSNPWNFVCDMLLEHRFGLPDPLDESVEAWVKRIALWQFAYGVRGGDGEKKHPTIARFLLRQRLRQRIGDTYGERELPPEAGSLNGVRVQTVHGAKGLEYEAVHLGFATAGSFGPDNPYNFRNKLQEIVPPEVLGSSDKEYEFEAAVERNNLLYVALSRAKRHLRIYQSNDFNGKNIAPQIRDASALYREIEFSEPIKKGKAAASIKAFQPADTVSFEHFETYAQCALAYWYAQKVGLKSEADLDPALRARLAIMTALKAVASGAEGAAQSHFLRAWEAMRLPSKAEDANLWRDAQLVYERGRALIKSHTKAGGTYSQPKTSVAGLNVELPWGFVRKIDGIVTFTIVRFARFGFSGAQTLLGPMGSELPYKGLKTIELGYVISDKTDAVKASGNVSMTKAYKAASKFLEGDNQPARGRHCGRCAYTTICPSSPSIKT
jgi:superfamily I DNA/RNA helicase